jgi:hypothetical protein
MAPVIRGNEIEFPSIKLKIRVASDGKWIQVGNHVFRQGKNENFEQYAQRINKTLSERQNSFYSSLLPEAQAYIFEWADLGVAGGIVVGLVGAIVNAPLTVILVAYGLAIGSVGFRSHNQKSLVDYVCYKRKPGSNDPPQFAFILKDGTKVEATVVDRAVYTKEDRNTSVHRSESLTHQIKTAAHYVAGECPDTKEFHREFQNDLPAFHKRVNPQEANAGTIN